MSAAAEQARRVELPPAWLRLERVAEDAAIQSATWRRRALEAEEELSRLRRSMEDLSAVGEQEELGEEVLRLRAENAALRSRMTHARRRVAALIKRLAALGVET